MTKFMIIDGNSMACRAAFAKRDMATSYGRETGGTNIFVGMIDSLLKKYEPTHMVVGWDVSRDTFRRQIDPEYKANRDSKSHNLYMQFEDIKRILDAIGIKYVGVYGYEADDVIGTYVTISQADENMVLSGDKDSFQLVDDKTNIYYPKMGVTNIEIVNHQVFEEKFEIPVAQFLDLKALMGDGGDNIIGIEKCGQKTAVKWLKEFGSLEGVVANADNIKGKVGENLRTWLPRADINKQLVTIKRDVPVPFTFEECEITKVDWENARPIFEELEFNKIIEKLDGGKFYAK